MRTALSSLLVLVACGGGGGSSDGNNPDIDASPADDAALPSVDAPPAPMTITLTGTATARSIGGAQPVGDAMVGAYRSTDEATPVATTTTDAQGNFTLTIDTGGVALDGFLKATKANYVDTYLYAPAPIAADTADVAMNMLTTGNYGTLYTLTQTQQQADTGTIAVLVTSGSPTMPVAGATVSSNPAGTYKYNGGNGLPSNNATSTNDDGIAYVLNAPAGAITVSADKAGSTFKPNAVKAFADALTTTYIIPQ